MLERTAQLAVRKPWRVMAITLVLVLLAAVFGSQVFPKLSNGGFVAEDSESERAARILAEQFAVSPPNVVILIDGLGKSADDPAVVAAGNDIASRLAAEPAMSEVQSYWATGAPALRSTDGTKALIVGQLAQPDEKGKDIVENFSDDPPGVEVMVGGAAAIAAAINGQVSEDLAKAETIALPLVLLLMILVFGGLIAAIIPVLVGVLAIVGAFLILFLFSLFTDVSVFSVNLVTMLGLGLGIDYSLFVVSRYREELKNGLERSDAIVRATRTAGRTVIFSAIAIAASLAALLAFPVYFLRSFAYAGVGVVAIAAIASVVFLPALLSALGPRIDRFRVIRTRSIEDESPFWAAVARFVMRRPVVVAISTTLALALLAVPFLSVRWGAIDDRVLPADAPSHLVSDALRTDFPGQDQSTLTVVARANSGGGTDYASRLSTIKDIERVDTVDGSFARGTQISGVPGSPALQSGDWQAYRVVLAVESASTAGVNAAEAVRELDAPFETLVAGFASSQVDSNEPIADNLLLAAALLAGASFVILFLMTGSLVLPIKAVLMAALSLTAALGAIVWIFQYGNLSDLLRFTPTGTIDHTNVLVMFCIAFGLSMDYEVFLLSRIKEAHDSGADTSEAIAHGLARSGRLVTAAALLISVVFLAFATSGIAFIKLIGLGLAISIIVDATIVRGLLVPAFMRLLGNANWWAPGPMKRVHARIGVSESAS